MAKSRSISGQADRKWKERWRKSALFWLAFTIMERRPETAFHWNASERHLPNTLLLIFQSNSTLLIFRHILWERFFEFFFEFLSENSRAAPRFLVRSFPCEGSCSNLLPSMFLGCSPYSDQADPISILCNALCLSDRGIRLRSECGPQR